MAGGRLPNIKILATGGTIAGRGESSLQTVGYAPAVIEIGALMEVVPELKKIANISGEQVTNIASTAITPDVWLLLASRVNELLASDEADGVVITHGTSTVEETAYFLNLVVKSPKPVVLVGAMRPATALSADGPVNLLNAVALAGSFEAGGKGVLICLNDEINAARDSGKTNALTLETFKAAELGFLGYMVERRPHFYRAPTRRHTFQSEFEAAGLQALPRVDIVLGHAHADRVQVDAVVAAGTRGIVYANVSPGTIPPLAMDGLVEASRKGILIVRGFRGGQGVVSRVALDDEHHFVTGDNLSPQKARILLMLSLTKTNDPEEVQRIFNEY